MGYSDWAKRMRLGGRKIEEDNNNVATHNSHPKDYEPINFRFSQSDMEKILFQLDKVINGTPDKEQLELIKRDIERKIELHKEWGEWV